MNRDDALCLVDSWLGSPARTSPPREGRSLVLVMRPAIVVVISLTLTHEHLLVGCALGYGLADRREPPEAGRTSWLNAFLRSGRRAARLLRLRRGDALKSPPPRCADSRPRANPHRR